MNEAELQAEDEDEDEDEDEETRTIMENGVVRRIVEGLERTKKEDQNKKIKAQAILNILNENKKRANERKTTGDAARESFGHVQGVNANEHSAHTPAESEEEPSTEKVDPKPEEDAPIGLSIKERARLFSNKGSEPSPSNAHANTKRVPIDPSKLVHFNGGEKPPAVKHGNSNSTLWAKNKRESRPSTPEPNSPEQSPGAASVLVPSRPASLKPTLRPAVQTLPADAMPEYLEVQENPESMPASPLPDSDSESSGNAWNMDGMSFFKTRTLDDIKRNLKDVNVPTRAPSVAVSVNNTGQRQNTPASMNINKSSTSPPDVPEKFSMKKTAKTPHIGIPTYDDAVHGATNDTAQEHDTPESTSPPDVPEKFSMKKTAMIPHIGIPTYDDTVLGQNTPTSMNFNKSSTSPPEVAEKFSIKKTAKNPHIVIPTYNDVILGQNTPTSMNINKSSTSPPEMPERFSMKKTKTPHIDIPTYNDVILGQNTPTSMNINKSSTSPPEVAEKLSMKKTKTIGIPTYDDVILGQNTPASMNINKSNTSPPEMPERFSMKKTAKNPHIGIQTYDDAVHGATNDTAQEHDIPESTYTNGANEIPFITRDGVVRIEKPNNPLIDLHTDDISESTYTNGANEIPFITRDGVLHIEKPNNPLIDSRTNENASMPVKSAQNKLAEVVDPRIAKENAKRFGMSIAGGFSECECICSHAVVLRREAASSNNEVVCNISDSKICMAHPKIRWAKSNLILETNEGTNENKNILFLVVRTGNALTSPKNELMAIRKIFDMGEVARDQKRFPIFIFDNLNFKKSDQNNSLSVGTAVSAPLVIGVHKMCRDLDNLHTLVSIFLWESEVLHLNFDECNCRIGSQCAYLSLLKKLHDSGAGSTDTPERYSFKSTLSQSVPNALNTLDQLPVFKKLLHYQCLKLSEPSDLFGLDIPKAGIHVSSLILSIDHYADTLSKIYS
ncbi:uncharacterized protein NEMAJ01_2382, partial [Nematocida major]|uniref:uncharacterized protein n=1 Tax=Nematocida major TaxID=1912982 RepID=UPI002008150C